ncbi:class I SAM-dependent methyltransferase [Phormidium sp. CCY1219]|uniref:class I SAM-dependent methyltransferase n=1 Tax=Phormidium sp. CCY1219 TaxID=2886104 RepID=UPI002D1EA76A|nr:class I SAM-dependent methyltransferase [Phormidium sp. CCY1219]MEB3829171.1 class I SAM-dependent methyltransferase [Phormidium sp. CCY1219]
MVSEAFEQPTYPSPQTPANFPAAQTPLPDAKPDPVVRDPTVLEQILRKKFKSLTGATGQIVMPCIPEMLEEHIQLALGVLSALGQNLTPEEIQALRQNFASKLSAGFQASPHARLIFKYGPPSPTQGLTSGLQVNATVEISSLEEKYNGWVKHRTGPLFGSHADAKLLDVAATLRDPARSPILDVGAGTGRNTFPLARKGHPVDAVELTPVFAQKMFSEAQTHQLPVRIIQGNILNPKLKLTPGSYKLAVVSEVISHFRDRDSVSKLLTKLSNAVQPGGFLLFNAFLTVEGYHPPEQVRQMAEVVWSYLMTRDELAEAMAGLPWEIISDESVYEYERLHLPPEAWPPTAWFAGWATGRNIFPFAQTPPVELRWVLCRRS